MITSSTEFGRHVYQITDIFKTVMHFEILKNNPDKLIPGVLKFKSEGEYSKISGSEYLLIFKGESGWAKKGIEVRPSPYIPNVYHSAIEIKGKKSLLILQFDSFTKMLFIDVYKGFYPQLPGLLDHALAMHPYYYE
jgi:hypothetical protein